MSYYKQIDGVKYDNALIEAAKEAVAGRGDGRISKADAEKLLPFVTDGDKITDVEQATLVYLRANFTWTDKADAWFKDAIDRWSAGERPAQPAAPGRPTRSGPAVGETAIVVRIGSAYKTARFFPADAAAQAQDCAIVILSHAPDHTRLDAVWDKTRPHKTSDLPKDVEVALCRSGNAAVRASLWSYSRYLGSHNGRISWQCGFTNVPTDTLTAALTELGFSVIDGDTLV